MSMDDGRYAAASRPKCESLRRSASAGRWWCPRPGVVPEGAAEATSAGEHGDFVHGLRPDPCGSAGGEARHRAGDSAQCAVILVMRLGSGGVADRHSPQAVARADLGQSRRRRAGQAVSERNQQLRHDQQAGEREAEPGGPHGPRIPRRPDATPKRGRARRSDSHRGVAPIRPSAVRSSGGVRFASSRRPPAVDAGAPDFRAHSATRPPRPALRSKAPRQRPVS